MNTITNAKPKTRFSSRNLNVVYKAPLRTKPLPDHATGPLQRLNSRMVVLGRTSVAPPAPLNTPSMKREGQVLDVRVSLVPASSHWAERADVPQKIETPERSLAPSDDVGPIAATGKVWTPESVAEHLYTDRSSLPIKNSMAENSGRWGDDAVEHDIVQKSLYRQMQKERDFPGLHGEANTTQMLRTDTTSPLPHSKQQYGRATGRWVHYNGEMPRSDCWSRGHDGRREEDHWARDYSVSKCADQRPGGCRFQPCEASGRDGRGQPSDSSDSKAISSILIDKYTDFSRSGARAGIVASGDQDCRVDHDGLAYRDGLALNQAPAVNSILDQESVCAWGRAGRNWPGKEKLADSITDESPALSTDPSLSPLQDAERPKMLFDPKTGEMVKASEILGSGKRQPGGRSSIVKNVAKLDSKDASQRLNGQVKAQSKGSMKLTRRSRQTDDRIAAAVADGSVGDSKFVQKVEATEDVTERSTSVASSSVCTESTENKLLTRKCKEKRSRKVSGGKPARSTLSCQEQSRPQLAAANARADLRPNNSITTDCGRQNESLASKKGISKKSRRRSSGKASAMTTQPLQETPSTLTPFKRTEDETSEDAVGPLIVQEEIEVRTLNDGFETVKSRRVVLLEKKQLRERLASIETADLGPDKEKCSSAMQSKKGKDVRKHCASAVTMMDMQTPSKPRVEAGKTCKSARQTVRDRKHKQKLKHVKQAVHLKSENVSANTDTSESTDTIAATVQAGGQRKATEQDAGEAPAESPCLKECERYVKTVVATKDKRKQKQHSSSCNLLGDQTASEYSARAKPSSEICNQKALTTMKQRRTATKLRPKQTRLMYVVKTSVSPSSTSSAA